MAAQERLTILAVEDSDDDRLALQRAFAQEGISVPIHFARDGGEAIDYLKRSGSYTDASAHPFPNLLLLDLNLPGADGFTVLEWLKARPGLRLQMLIIVLSGAGDPIIEKKASQLGADIFLCKTGGSGELVAMVKRLKQMIETPPGERPFEPQRA